MTCGAIDIDCGEDYSLTGKIHATHTHTQPTNGIARWNILIPHKFNAVLIRRASNTIRCGLDGSFNENVCSFAEVCFIDSMEIHLIGF